MQFKVPQFLEVEDKVAGPLTLKQLGWLAAGGVITFLLYQYLEFWLFVLVAIPITLLCLALAFVKIRGRPFVSILIAFINYFLKPKLFVWRRRPQIKH